MKYFIQEKRLNDPEWKPDKPSTPDERRGLQDTYRELKRRTLIAPPGCKFNIKIDE
jgi:hypothetical protein